MLYEVVRDHLETFLAQATHDRDDAGMPRFVERELSSRSILHQKQTVTRGQDRAADTRPRALDLQRFVRGRALPVNRPI